ncbi:MAG: MG2 domain-containing protein, partial [Armatimonadota bacterium]|nr:MG2 domain-containing protein [Armatimonadota bacterium]
MDLSFRDLLLIGFGAVVVVGGLTAGHERTEAQDGLPRLETRLYGQSAWLAGSTASLRIVALDHRTGNAVPNTRVQVALAPAEKGSRRDSAVLFRGQTNALGTVDASFRVPEWPAGGYQLTVSTTALGETDQITRNVALQTGEQVLLTTDKPLYQPGQTMHLRALVLRRADRRPLADTSATLEVEDAKGNKVFKKAAKTSAHGILAADFVLANEVNQGRYTVRALVGEAREEKSVTVERYVLPKFRVTLTPEQRFYQPGQVFSARVEGAYFFGKPVQRAKVKVTLSKFDAGFEEFAQVEGFLDEAGVFKFQQALPTYFVGQPLQQGNAFVKYDVTVTDTADHTEKISGMVPVAAQPMRITVLPESGRVV